MHHESGAIKFEGEQKTGIGSARIGEPGGMLPHDVLLYLPMNSAGVDLCLESRILPNKHSRIKYFPSGTVRVSGVVQEKFRGGYDPDPVNCAGGLPYSPTATQCA